MYVEHEKKGNIHLLLCLLLERILRNSLESLFDVDSFFRRSFKVGDVAFRLAPTHSTLLSDLYMEGLV